MAELLQLQCPPDTAMKPWLEKANITAWLGLHYERYTNRQLAAMLNVGITTLRNRLYALGLRRMEMEYWTPEQEAELRRLYPSTGDIGLAALFQQRYPKCKVWTKKHIEKKRLYLGLKRTPAMLATIHARQSGRPVDVQHQQAFGQTAATGELRVFHYQNGRPRTNIKCADGKWRLYAPIVWSNAYGPIPAGWRVLLLDGDATNCALTNLRLVRHEDMPQLSCSPEKLLQSDRWIAYTLTHPRHGTAAQRAAMLQHPHLLRLRRLQLTLQRTIKHATV